MIDLNGKVTVITGGASGIGAAIAAAFVDAGAIVWVVDRDETGASNLSNTLGGERRGAFSFRADVSDQENCDALRTKVFEHHGRLDVLVNNAGIGHVGNITNTTVEDLDRLYRVNVRGVLAMTKSFLPDMIARCSGNVVNMASVGGLLAVPDRLAYCATKFAVVGITKSLALDHAKDGVRINCICPGRVETPFVTARLREYSDPEKAYRSMCESQPMGRMGRPEEIAAAAVYLASDAAAFVTGTALSIDGGWSAG